MTTLATGVSLDSADTSAKKSDKRNVSQLLNKTGLLFLLSGLLLSNPAYAEIYKWVDSAGQTHFSQTPPTPDTQSDFPEVSKVQVNKHGPSSQPRTVEGTQYCGDLRLPSDSDPIIQLSNISYKLDHWRDSLKREQKRRSELATRQLKYRMNTQSYENGRSRIRETDASISDLQCALRWAPKRQEKLQNARKEFESTLQAARDDFERWQNRCGAKPDIEGYTSDPRAKEWVKCISAGGTSTHNKKLRNLKNLESRAAALNDLEQPDNQRTAAYEMASWKM